MKVATIDIGTNTTRLAIIDKNSMKIINKFRTVTRLGENFNGNLDKDAINRVVNIIKLYKTVMDKYNVEKFRGVATSVVREAANGKELIDKIYRETELRIEIISGEEEAELTFYGVLSVLDKNIKDFILLDIGGGSNEYILVKDRKIVNSISLKFGVVFLYEKYVKNDPPGREELKKIETEIKKHLKIVKEKFANYVLNNLSFVGTAGTITTLSAIELGLNEYAPEKVNNNKISKDFLIDLINDMINLTNKERFEKYNIEKGREDVIVPGLLIVKHTMEFFNFQQIISIDSSLLEGIAYKMK